MRGKTIFCASEVGGAGRKEVRIPPHQCSSFETEGVMKNVIKAVNR